MAKRVKIKANVSPSIKGKFPGYFYVDEDVANRIVDKTRNRRFRDLHFSVNLKGYAFTNSKSLKGGYKTANGGTTTYVHQFVYGSRKAGFQIDHKNRRRNDNTSANLRQVTRAENYANRVLYSNANVARGLVKKRVVKNTLGRPRKGTANRISRSVQSKISF